MATTHLLYVCPLPGQGLDSQLAIARGRIGESAQEVREEAPGAWRSTFPVRQVGARLLGEMESGATLIVASPLVLGPTLADAIELMHIFSARGVHLRIFDVGNVGNGASLDSRELGWPTLIGTLEAWKRFDRGHHREEIRRGMARLKAEGARRSTYPPIGFRFEREGKRCLVVPDEIELEVIAKVVRWRAEGHWSWQAIARHLLQNGIVTSSGLDWHPRRLQKAVALAKSGQLPPLPTGHADPAELDEAPQQAKK